MTNVTTIYGKDSALLIQCIIAKNQHAAIQLIQEGNIDFMSPSKKTPYPNVQPFVLAASYGLIQLMQVMIKQVEKILANKATCKFKSKQEFINQVIQQGEHENYNALLYAGTYDQLDTMNFLIAEGANYKMENTPYKMPIIMLAAYHGLDKMLFHLGKAYIKEKLNPNPSISAGNLRGETPLSLAATKGHLKAIEILIKELQINPDSMLSKGENARKTALDLCIENGHTQTAVYLITHGANYCQSADADSMLLSAVEHNNPEIVACLIEQARKDITNKNNKKIKFSTLADFVNWTIKAKRNVFYGTNAVYRATEKGSLAITKLLVKAGGKWKEPLKHGSEEGISPLFAACEGMYYDVIQYLLTLDPGNNATLLNSKIPTGVLKDKSLLYLVTNNARRNTDDKEKMLLLLMQHGAKVTDAVFFEAENFQFSEGFIQTLSDKYQSNVSEEIFSNNDEKGGGHVCLSEIS